MKHFLLLIIVLLGCVGPAQALDPSVRLGAYHHDTWTGEQGAPREIEAMAQTADGWLWLGTTSGLVRFDGVRFETFVPRQGERLVGQSITALAPRPNGELWIGYTFGGMSVLKDGRLRHVAATPGKPIAATFSIAFERDDSVWVASSSGLFHYKNDTWTKAGPAQGYPAERSDYVYRDHYDRLWASSGDALYLLDRTTGRFRQTMLLKNNPLLIASPDGRIWVSDGTSVQALPAPPGGWRPRPETGLHASSFQALFDRDGNYWTGNCRVGLCRTYPATWQGRDAGFPAKDGDERLDQPWQMSSLNVHSMMEDREGNVWVGTVAGLERFRHNKLIRVPFPSNAERLTIAQDASGLTWANTNGLGNIHQVWKIIDGVAVPHATDQRTYSVSAGKDGSVLVGGIERIERRLGERLLASYPLPELKPGPNTRNYVLFAVEDRDSMWVAISGRGLYRWRDGLWSPPADRPHLRGAMFVSADPQGKAWIGIRDGRLVRYDGEQWREFGEREGVNVGAVRFVDARNEVLIGGDNGMAVLRGERFHPLASDQPGQLDNVSGVVVSPDGDRWLNTSKGLLRVRSEDWRRSMANPAIVLKAELWNDADGYPGSAETIARVPSAFLARDGKVWVAGTAGAAWFDPARLHRNQLPPKVAVQALQVAGRRYVPGEVSAFAPGTDRLQIEYAALSYTMPERVRFRYRLVGADRDFQEVGSRRVAYYTNLGPGRYRFEVAAVNEDGVAGELVSTPEFTIKPRFVQTGWFVALCVLLGSLSIFLLYQLRLVQMKRQIHARLEARLNERERIARTLHDTFLQSLQGLILRLQGVAMRLPEDSETRAQLDSALDLADKVVAEGRDQVMDLRIVHEAPTLADALAEAAQALRAGSDVEIAVRSIGDCIELPAAVHYEVFNIAREAIANAVRHARASSIEIELECGKRSMTVAVRDDGVGFDEHTLTNGRPGHWGLTGMRERADKIGATLTIRNRPARGAEVILNLSRWLAVPSRDEPAVKERSISEA